MLKRFGFILTLAAGAILSSQSEAMPIQPLGDDASMVVKVVDGCGPGWYRGPGGACHRFGRGPYPGGYWGPYQGGYGWNGCPPGYWRGPWGHCRNTPYHGPLPGGGWQ